MPSFQFFQVLLMIEPSTFDPLLEPKPRGGHKGTLPANPEALQPPTLPRGALQHHILPSRVVFAVAEDAVQST
jgi:hypothetical protein